MRNNEKVGPSQEVLARIEELKAQAGTALDELESYANEHNVTMLWDRFYGLTFIPTQNGPTMQEYLACGGYEGGPDENGEYFGERMEAKYEGWDGTISGWQNSSTFC